MEFKSLNEGKNEEDLNETEINVKHLGWHEYSGNLLNYIIGMGK